MRRDKPFPFLFGTQTVLQHINCYRIYCLTIANWCSKTLKVHSTLFLQLTIRITNFQVNKLLTDTVRRYEKRDTLWEKKVGSGYEVVIVWCAVYVNHSHATYYIENHIYIYQLYTSFFLGPSKLFCIRLAPRKTLFQYKFQQQVKTYR